MSANTIEAAPQITHRYKLDSGLDRLTPAERAQRGKEARAEVPRESHAVFDPGPGRAGPIRSACWRSRRSRGCRNWCRSGAAGCWRPRSPKMTDLDVWYAHADLDQLRAQFDSQMKADPLFLQVKEAEASVLSRFVGASKYANMGQRVVAGQRLMQASSDIFLGWQRAEAGLDGKQRDFYVRQLRDWKYSIAIEDLVPRGMRIYGQACGWTLARAHARAGDRIAIAAYLGGSDVFDKAITQFASAYADQNERDHKELVDAVASGQLAAEPDM